jgi:hypothetical protein
MRFFGEPRNGQTVTAHQSHEFEKKQLEGKADQKINRGSGKEKAQRSEERDK